MVGWCSGFTDDVMRLLADRSKGLRHLDIGVSTIKDFGVFGEFKKSNLIAGFV